MSPPSPLSFLFLFLDRSPAPRPLALSPLHPSVGVGLTSSSIHPLGSQAAACTRIEQARQERASELEKESLPCSLGREKEESEEQVPLSDLYQSGARSSFLPRVLFKKCTRQTQRTWTSERASGLSDGRTDGRTNGASYRKRTDGRTEFDLQSTGLLKFL